MLDKDVGFENLEPDEYGNSPKEVIMAFQVMIALFVGLIAGGAIMAIWAARRIGDEAARQFDRGFERGRWMADLSMHQGLDPQGSPRQVHLIMPDDPTATGGPGLPDPPTLLKPQRIRPAEPRS
jgi:hypothetical protein